MSTLFSDLGVQSKLIESLSHLSITEPTDIQKQTIPVVLNKSDDVVAIAKTGSGKTLAFGLPLLQLINTDQKNVQAVILTPTRELAQQIQTNLSELAANNPELQVLCVAGGTSIKPQIAALSNDVQIIVATPGRLIDLIQRDAVDLSNNRFLVLDEADEMVKNLQDGLDKIVAVLPKNKRTLLFTATMPGTIKQLVQNYLSKNTIHLATDSEMKGHTSIVHEYVVVDPIEKLDVLMHFLNSKPGQRGIIFCKTKAAVNKLAKNLAINKFKSGAIHGSLSQAIRDRIMDQFRNGYIDILIATDLVARGIDVKEVTYVVNYHLPDTYDAYIHRTGRTARAEASGYALTILQKNELFEVKDFEEELDISFQKMKKSSAESIEENNTKLWARKIFKTKPNQNIPATLKQDIHDIFHHLTKDELVDKLLSQYLMKQSEKNKPAKKKSQRR